MKNYKLKLNGLNSPFSISFDDASELDLLLDIEQSMPNVVSTFNQNYSSELTYTGDDEDIKSLFIRARIGLYDIVPFIECLEFIDNHYDSENRMLALDYLATNRNMDFHSILEHLDEVKIREGSLAKISQDEYFEIYEIESIPTNLKQFIDWTAYGESLERAGEYDELSNGVYVTNGNAF